MLRGPIFPFTSLTLFLLLASGFSPTMAQDEPVRLQYKLKEGDVLEYQVQMSVFPKGRSTTIGGTETLIVSQVSEEDVLTITHLASDVRLLKADGKDITELSDEEIGKLFPWGVKTPVWESFFEKPWRVKIKSDVSNHPLLGASTWQVHRSGKTVASDTPTFWQSPSPGGTFSRHFPLFWPIGEWAQNFHWVFGQPWIEFPETPINMGEGWSQSSVVNVFNQKGEVRTTYTLVGFKDVNGYYCAEIRLEQGPSTFEIFAARLLRMQGTLYYAIDEGFLVREELALVVVMRREGEITLTSELTQRKRLSPRELEQARQDIAHEADRAPDHH